MIGPGCEDDKGKTDTLGNGVILSKEMGGGRVELRNIGRCWVSIVLIGLGVRGAGAEMVDFSVGLCKSDMGFATGSSGEIRVFLLDVSPLGNVIKLWEETLGGGGNGGGNFPERTPLSVPSVVLPNPPISPPTVCAGSVDLDLTSERNSRSSLERANELRGEEDDARGRENR